MTLSIVPLTAEHIPAVRRFSQRTWQRTGDDWFYKWRYLECPTQPSSYLVTDGDECFGMLAVFEKPWLVGDRIVPVLEPHDWFCDPAIKGSGMGRKMMQMLMDTGQTLLILGGTSFTRTLLPRMGWAETGQAPVFRLPIGGSMLAQALARRLRVPARILAPASELAARTWFRPRMPRIRAGDRVVPVGCPDGDDVRELYTDQLPYRLAQVPSAPFLRWLGSGHPSTGQLVSLYFIRDGQLHGWSVARVYTRERTEAQILEVISRTRDVATYTWMISEMVVRLAAFAPERIDCMAHCEVVQNALRKLRFIAMNPMPLYLWLGQSGVRLPDGPVSLGLLTLDLPTRPYAPRWPADPEPVKYR